MIIKKNYSANKQNCNDMCFWVWSAAQKRNFACVSKSIEHIERHTYSHKLPTLGG